MTGTAAYAVKRSLFDLLEAASATGQPLDGVDIAYGWRGDLGLESIYGGGITFNQADAVAEGNLRSEETVVSLYVRVSARPPVDPDVTDARADEILAAIDDVLLTDSSHDWRVSLAGNFDYSRTESETTTVLTVRVTLGAYLVVV